MTISHLGLLPVFALDRLGAELQVREGISPVCSPTLAFLYRSTYAVSIHIADDSLLWDDSACLQASASQLIKFWEHALQNGMLHCFSQANLQPSA